MGQQVRPKFSVVTNIDSSVRTSELIPAGFGFEVYRNDRTLHGGGVMLLVKSNITQMPIAELENSSEAVWVKVMVNGLWHYISSWYRPSDMSVDDFKFYKEQLVKIQSMNKGRSPNIHVLGDLNYRDIDWSTGLNKEGSPLCDSGGQILLDVMHDLGLEQMVRFPTREKNTLDLIITSLPKQFVDVSSPDRLSDHDIISGTLKVKVERKRFVRRKFFLYGKGDYDSMRKAAKDFGSEKYFNGHSGSRNIEENWLLVKNFLKEIESKFIPSRESKSSKGLPWLSMPIRRLIRRRNKTHAKAKRWHSDRLLGKWKNLRREIKDKLKDAHDTYVNNMIGDMGKDPKPFWKYINGKKKDSQNIPPLKKGHTDKLAESDKDKAEALNGQFSSVFSKSTFQSVPFLARKVPQMPEINITVGGVVKILKGLNPSKASGPDEIHPKILKELANELGPIFRDIFQQSLNSGRIPSDWTQANICPLYKKGDRAVPSNYRPVSLTSIPCKLLEHIVCSNIMGHLEKNSVITDKQHAFRRFHSCETQLCHVVDDWSKSLDNAEQVDVFIMDLEKAFDTPPHELLKSKLYQYGFSKTLLNWIDAFLCHRSQRVVVNGEKSQWCPVNSGVPQGTVLGPVLFTLYINDMVEDIDSHIRLFADDCVCYRTIRNDGDRVRLQEDIDKLGSWARKWGMRFQPVKCNTMEISRKRSKVRTSYTLEGSVLEYVSNVKYLGVTISDNLSWDSHVAAVCSKANKTLGLLKRNLSKCPQQVKEVAYKGLVRPVLEYASAVWDPHCIRLKDDLERVQNRSARFVVGNYCYDEGSMTGILKQLGWRSLGARRRDTRLLLFYKGQKGKANLPIENLVTPIRRSKHHHSMHFHIPYARTDSYKYSFVPNTVRDWNSLPAKVIASAESSTNPISTFTSILKKD